jgi:Family of unknown function (DUF5906)
MTIEPAPSTCADLKAAAAEIAVGVILLRAWPNNYHNTALRLGGFLARAGWQRDDIYDFVKLIAEKSGSEKPAARGKDAADAAEAHARGENVYGLPGLKECFGEKPAEQVAKLLNYRESAQASGVANDPYVDELNQTYALVIVGDKTVVMTTTANRVKFLTLSAFEQWFANRFVQRETGNGVKNWPLAKHWLHHPHRRQYEGIVFAPKREVPGHFNLWSGFAVQPRPGDCSKFLAHLKDNVCCRDGELFRWVVGWFAEIIQHPEKKSGTSLALRGRQGVGKTKVGQVFGSLLGVHYYLASEPRYVTGRFNSHMVSLLLLHCDEAFWAGDRAAEGKIKDMITGDYQTIEYKGKEPISVRNFARLLVSGNQDWLIPAGFEERRFATLDVSEEHMKDHSYFAAIDAEMDNGGREALLDYLLRFDLSKVNLREIPKTAALLAQKISSGNPEQSWWLDTLMNGELPWGVNEPNKCPASRLFARYLKHARLTGVRRRSIETQFGIFLNKAVPGLIKKDGSYPMMSGKTRRGYIYTFPSLAECRAACAAALQQDVKWSGDKADWTTEPDRTSDDDEEGPF